MVLLVAENISKSFGATRALQDVQLTLKKGRVHALVGENGAGKSTLFKICAGVIPHDTGAMTLGDVPYAPRNMREAQQAGVALVFQEMTINASLGIAENILIDRMRDYAGIMGLTRWRKLEDHAQALLDEIDSGISVKQDLQDLDLGQRKILEIARALSYRPRALLLDESTAFLSNQEIRSLFKVIHTLRSQGIAIGYISHHLDEIEEIADDITILKDGTWAGHFVMGELTNDQIEARMVGREIGKQIYPEDRDFDLTGEIVLDVRGLHVPKRLQDISLELHRGEILGVGGLKGSGGDALVGAIIGDIPYTSGEMIFQGKPYAPRKPFHAWEHGIAYLPGDRTGEGLIVDFSVRDNLSMASIPHKTIFVDYAAEKQLVDKYMPMLQIKAETPNVPCNSLSGGNLQKVVLGKCMAPQPDLLILNNPTRGIDVGARMQIYSVIRKLAEEGISVILLSEDLPELIGMSDRILVMRKGKISKVFNHADKPSEEEVVTYMI